MRAAVYLRQSLDRTGEGLAVARQREDCLLLCEQRGWEPVEYVDNDTSASSKKRRPAYQKLLEDIDSGAVQGVVAWDLDRLHRRPIELEHFMELADSKGLALATVTGDVDLSTDNGRLFARIKGAVARAEVERKAARQRRAARQTAEAGKPGGGPRPFGYERSGDVKEDEASLVRDAYKAVLAGESLFSIAQKWTSLGVTTTLGKKWRGTTVRQLLMRPRYAGYRTYLGEVVADGRWEPLVSSDVWHGAQAVLTAPGRGAGPGATRLLTGILECGKCGASMSGGLHKSGYRIYACRACYGNSRRAEPIDELVTGLVVAFLQTPDAQTLMVDSTREDIVELRAEEAALLGRVDQLAVDYAEGNLTGRDVKIARERLETQLSALRGRMLDANGSVVFEGVLGPDAGAAWVGLSLARRRAVIRRLLVPVLAPGGRGRGFKPEDVVVRWLTDE